MIKTTAEIIETLRTKIGEDTSDESLAFLEDVADTLSDLEKKTKDATNWETKFKENDEAWRKKYRDRFFGSETDDDIVDDDKPTPSIVKFDDLFKEEN